MYNGKLGLSKNNDKAVFNVINNNRMTIDRSIHSNGPTRILCIIRRSTNPNVLYNRGMRGTRAKGNGSVLFFLLHVNRVSVNANKYNVYI